VALLEKVEQLARARDPRIVQVMAGLASEYDVILVARADGTVAADVRPLVRLSLTVIAEQTKDGAVRRESGTGGGGGRFGLGYFQDDVIATYVDDAVRAALVNLDSRPAKAGEMSVVLGPGWPGVLLHEAIGHGLEGDFNRKGSSAFAGRMGQRVAAKGVTVLDDGTLADRRGSLNVDDEGNATQRNVLIEDGILTGYIQDNLNARLMGVKPTGNGRRESYAALPMPRMTNTYMLGGDRDPEEIVRGLKRGLYATNFGGGQVDITSGKFVFSASEAFWVENGKIQYPVKGATLIGNGPDALTRVSAIGNDMRLDTGVGVCGKEGRACRWRRSADASDRPHHGGRHGLGAVLAGSRRPYALATAPRTVSTTWLDMAAASSPSPTNTRPVPSDSSSAASSLLWLRTATSICGFSARAVCTICRTSIVWGVAMTSMRACAMWAWMSVSGSVALP
jgi:TldD protein